MYNGLVEDLGSKVDRTEKNVKEMADRLSTKFVGKAPGDQDIPLEPLRVDYPCVPYWVQDDWLRLRGGHGPDTDSPTYSIFMVDASGDPIPEGVRADLRTEVVTYWNQIFRKGITPLPYDDNDADILDQFRTRIEKKFPWLRLCEGHWKVKQVWKNCYGGWKKKRLSATPPITKIEPAQIDGNLKNRVVIEVTSSDDNSVGSKHGREEDLPVGSSKKHKGKEGAKPNFHHAKPAVKKLKAKVARVSVSLFSLKG
jgi:hypothetical protein